MHLPEDGPPRLPLHQTGSASRAQMMTQLCQKLFTKENMNNDKNVEESSRVHEEQDQAGQIQQEKVVTEGQ